MLHFSGSRKPCIFGNSEYVYKPRGVLTLCKAASSGIVPPDDIPDLFETSQPSKEVLELSKKFDDFTGTLQTVPPVSDPNYTKVTEGNAKNIWDYAAKQYTDKLVNKVDGFKVGASSLFKVDKYGSSATDYVGALFKCRKVFARGVYANFWAAIGIKVQLKRVSEQRIDPNLGVDQELFREIEANLIYIGKGFAYNARTTQTRKYMEKTSKSQKEEDARQFQSWYVKKVHPVVRIVRLSIQDMPLNYAFDETSNFELDPSEANKKALIGKLNDMKKAGITAYKAKSSTGSGFDFDAWYDSL